LIFGEFIAIKVRMALKRSPVAMIKNAGECVALGARIAELERIVRELQSKVESVERAP
jgi:hypothetical protein